MNAPLENKMTRSNQLILLATVLYCISIFFNSSYLYIVLAFFALGIASTSVGVRYKNFALLLLIIYLIMYLILPARPLAVWFTEPLTIIELGLYPLLKFLIVYTLFQFLVVNTTTEYQQQHIKKQQQLVFSLMFLSYTIQPFILNVDARTTVIIGLIVTSLQWGATIIFMKLWRSIPIQKGQEN